jgi:citrate lyase subunit beta/citryl-CoA lyase
MRSLLFAGALRPDLVAKLPRSNPDAVVVDLEDAVPHDHKDSAREGVAALVESLRDAHPGQDVYIRVNAVDTPWFDADMAALTAGATGIIVPKIEEPGQLAVVAEALADARLADLRVVAGIESARGIVSVETILHGSPAAPPPHAAYFGAEDLIADLGGERTPGGEEVLYARSRFVLAARIAGVVAVDQAVVDFRDDERFATDARAGRRLGYRGKICVHPSQVTLANEIFGAGAAEVERARRLLDAAARAAAEGVGAIEFEGEMVDKPALTLARETLRRAGAQPTTASAQPAAVND